MIRRRSFLGAVCSALLTTAVLPDSVGATVLVERSLDELAREADAVVVATPGRDRRSFWRGGRIYTDVPVAVSVVIAGRVTAPGMLTVRLPGGVVGEVGQSLAGAPVLDADVPVVLFLGAPRDGARSVLSLSAGVLPMNATPGGVTVLPARTEELTTVPAPGRVASPRFALPPGGLPLAAFVARVREVLR